MSAMRLGDAWPTACERCGKDPVGVSTMSMFNRDTICIQCKDDERLAPGYEAANRTEAEQCRLGNYNYSGVGLSAADAAFLAERRRQR